MTFSIAEPGRIWIVLSGTLDLFLVDMRRSEPIGPRRHLMRVEEGAAVFGMNPPAAGNVGLLANPGEGTQVLCLEKKQIQQADPCLWTDVLLPLMEQWIFNLGMAASDQAAPKVSFKLEAGKEVTLEDQPAAVLPVDTLVWVQHLQGSSHFLGSHDVPPIDQHSFFPVTRVAWLECAPNTRLECFDTSSYSLKDPEWSGLSLFSNLILAYLNFRQTKKEQKERERMVARSEADVEAVEEALLTLGAPLREAVEDLPLSGHTVGDPLLQACQALGRVAGIEIKPPPDALHGIRARDPLAAIAKASGVRTRLVLLKGKWWKQDNGPLLGFFEAGNEPVALLPHSATAYRVFDPLRHQTSKVTEEVASNLKGVAYTFYRSFPPRAIKFKDLIAFGLHGCQRDLVTIVLMGIATGLLAMLTPIFTGIIFDTIIPGAQRSALANLTIFLLVSAFAGALFQLTRSFAVLRLEGKMDASTQAAVWDRTISLPVPFFRNYTAGDLAWRALGISQIRQTLTGATLSSILSGIFSIFSFALLFYYNWRLALVATTLIAVAFVASFLCGYIQIRFQREVSQLRGRISGMMLQFISGIAKFRVSGTEGRVFAVWAREFAKQKVIYFRARKVSNGLSVFQSAFPVAASGAIFYYAGFLTPKPSFTSMTTGEFLAFYAAFTQFLAASLQLSSSVLSVLGVIPLFERAKPILETTPEVQVGRPDPGELTGRIEMNHVVFRYREDMPLVIKDLSLTILPGQFVAFVGSSGSGKSTLFRLLLGFEKPVSGTIYYDAQDLAGVDVQAVRRQIGVVLQNGRLLSGSIFANIVGAAQLTINDAWEAARLAGFDQDIEQMPMGMHTVVSEGGGGLSGGQRQRLMIARAIVGKPRILLFDEATSALDNQTQAIVSRSLESLNATRIVIAHRLSTVVKADRIFVVDKGEIVQKGTYSDLISQEGAFAELARRQLV
jgi:NHLM bacteriocin system ABC transporter ATP-binding protein